MNKIAQVDLGNQYGATVGTTRTLGQLVSIVLEIAIAGAGIGALLMFMWGGFQIISNAGKNNPQATAQGKQAVTWGLFGFILVIGAYWIIRLFENILGVNFVTAPTFTNTFGP